MIGKLTMENYILKKKNTYERGKKRVHPSLPVLLFYEEIQKIKKPLGLLAKGLLIIFFPIYHQKFTKYLRVKLMKTWAMKAGQNDFPR